MRSRTRFGSGLATSHHQIRLPMERRVEPRPRPRGGADHRRRLRIGRRRRMISRIPASVPDRRDAQAIAGCFDVDPVVSIKAKTNEGVDAVGRGEAIAARRSIELLRIRNQTAMRVRFHRVRAVRFLHVGNARTRPVQLAAGPRTARTFILRIEDTDTKRSRASPKPRFSDLRWLGPTGTRGRRGGAHGAARRSSGSILESRQNCWTATGPTTASAPRRSSTRSARPQRPRGARRSAARAVGCPKSRRSRASPAANGRRFASASPTITMSSSRTRYAAMSGFQSTSSAIRSSSGPTGPPPTTSPS